MDWFLSHQFSVPFGLDVAQHIIGQILGYAMIAIGVFAIIGGMAQEDGGGCLIVILGILVICIFAPLAIILGIWFIVIALVAILALRIYEAKRFQGWEKY